MNETKRNVRTSDANAITEVITPALARDYLERNTNNRVLKSKHIRMLASDIVNGNWAMNGDTIRFDKNGDLLDGQHRLHAVIAAGKPIKSIVVRGLAPEVFDSIDGGARRSAADFIGMQGKSNATSLAAMVRMIMMNEGRGKRDGIVLRKHDIVISNRDLLAALVRHPDAETAMELVTSEYKALKAWYTLALLGFLYYHLYTVDNAYVDAFFDRCEHGEGLKRGDPVYVLRQKLSTNSHLHENTMPNKTLKAALLIKAWNSERDGKTLKKLQLGEDDYKMIAK